MCGSHLVHVVWLCGQKTSDRQMTEQVFPPFWLKKSETEVHHVFEPLDRIRKGEVNLACLGIPNPNPLKLVVLFSSHLSHLAAACPSVFASGSTNNDKTTDDASYLPGSSATQARNREGDSVVCHQGMNCEFAWTTAFPTVKSQKSSIPGTCASVGSCRPSSGRHKCPSDFCPRT